MESTSHQFIQIKDCLLCFEKRIIKKLRKQGVTMGCLLEAIINQPNSSIISMCKFLHHITFNIANKQIINAWIKPYIPLENQSLKNQYDTYVKSVIELIDDQQDNFKLQLQLVDYYHQFHSLLFEFFGELFGINPLKYIELLFYRVLPYKHKVSPSSIITNTTMDTNDNNVNNALPYCHDTTYTTNTKFLNLRYEKDNLNEYSSNDILLNCKKDPSPISSIINSPELSCSTYEIDSTKQISDEQSKLNSFFNFSSTTSEEGDENNNDFDDSKCLKELDEQSSALLLNQNEIQSLTTLPIESNLYLTNSHKSKTIRSKQKKIMDNDITQSLWVYANKKGDQYCFKKKKTKGDVEQLMYCISDIFETKQLMTMLKNTNVVNDGKIKKISSFVCSLCDPFESKVELNELVNKADKKNGTITKYNVKLSKHYRYIYFAMPRTIKERNEIYPIPVFNKRLKYYVVFVDYCRRYNPSDLIVFKVRIIG